MYLGLDVELHVIRSGPESQLLEDFSAGRENVLGVGARSVEFLGLRVESWDCGFRLLYVLGFRLWEFMALSGAGEIHSSGVCLCMRF